MIAGKIALDKARQKANEFGQQSEKMTQIAQKARETAEELDLVADGIVFDAGMAKNKSTEAYELAKNATDKHKNITQDIRTLRNEVSNSETKLEKITEDTEAAEKEASEIHAKALNQLNAAKNLILPSINATKLKNLAEEVKDDAMKILNETESLLKENENVLGGIDMEVKAAKELVQRGEDQQQELDSLLVEVNAFKKQAELAVEKGDNTLKDARATHETLSRKLHNMFKYILDF